MSRRPLQPPIGRLAKAQSRMAPGGLLWSESPIPRRYSPRVREAGEEPPGPAHIPPPYGPLGVDTTYAANAEGFFSNVVGDITFMKKDAGGTGNSFTVTVHIPADPLTPPNVELTGVTYSTRTELTMAAVGGGAFIGTATMSPLEHTDNPVSVFCRSASKYVNATMFEFTPAT